GTGSRMKLAHTRAMLRAALSGALDRGKFTQDPIFGFQVPASVPEVPDGVLTPRSTWPDPKGYDAQARKLATMFRENFEQYRAEVPAEVAAAGPVV
nr:phosphoenolpyruvate carboxykinase (ATP) [Gemmatimonadales bacterium]